MMMPFTKASCDTRIAWALLIGLMASVSDAAGENWPGWRGPRGDGTSAETGVAIQWNGEAGSEKNVCWKVAIPGKGHASPVVWGSRVFVVTCDEERQERLLLCYDADSGKELWRMLVLRSPLEKKHTLNSFASSTPATDGERVYVTFLKADGEHVTTDGRASPGVMVVAAYDLLARKSGALNQAHSRACTATVAAPCSSTTCSSSMAITTATDILWHSIDPTAGHAGRFLGLTTPAVTARRSSVKLAGGRRWFSRGASV
jgi:hypothetical protein